ncbi:MAG: hypothetical protein M1834_003941 [Cirrosporium novae-zelandiae]|nr:MAG: hypothetical protein M1834_003941 [Cirrosporium novae-zelandiae]
MLSSPAKRRKVSATKAVDASPTSTRDARSARPASSHASYSSPTKASLSRFNPDLLPPERDRRTKPTESSRPRSQGRKEARNKDDAVPSANNFVEVRVERNLEDGPELGLRTSPSRKLFAVPRRQSRTLGNTERARNGLPTQGSDSSDILPEEVLSRQERRPLRHSSGHELLNGHSNEDDEIEEEYRMQPDLQRFGIEGDSGGPGEIASSSPSARRKEEKDSREALNSSPRRPKARGGWEWSIQWPSRATAMSQVVEEMLPNRPDSMADNSNESGVEEGGSGVEPGEESTSEKEQSPGTQEPIGGCMVDKKIVKKQELRDSLLSQLQNLQSDVQQLEQEIEKANEDPDSLENVDDDEVDKLITLLQTNDPLPKLQPPSAPPPISDILSSFLPFSRVPGSSANPSLPLVPDISDLPSYRPLDVDDPLDHLQAFTPLSFTSKVTTNLKPAPHQTHYITLTAPKYLLVLKISMIVDLETHRVANLTIQELSHWSEHELGTWIRDRAKKQKDVGGVCWAANRFWEAVQRRGQCWENLRKKFPELFGGSSDGDKHDRRSKGQKHNKKQPGKRRRVAESESESEEEGRGERASKPLQIINPHLSPSRLLFRSHLPENTGVALQISWNINITWTGDTEDAVSASASIPQAWKDDDERGVLRRIPEVFGKLVQKGGVEGAASVVVGLLFKTQDADQ